MLALLLAAELSIVNTGRIETPFNEGWEYCRRDGSWQSVTLPHDCAIREGFDAKLDSVTGDLFCKRIVQYRRVWNLSEKLPGRRYALAFGGVMSESRVLVNGQSVGGGEYGCLGFQVDATAHLRAGSNLVTVVADTTRMRSRWYPGAGICRQVKLCETDLIRLGEDSLAVATENVLTSNATVKVTGEVINESNADAACQVRVRILSPTGICVAVSTVSAAAAAHQRGSFAAELAVKEPVLWQMGGPAALYTVRVSIVSGAKDSLSRRICFRETKFSTLHIVPDHWNFGYAAIPPPTTKLKTKYSKPVLPVCVYTSAPEAELFLNGVSMGRRRKATGPVGTDTCTELPRNRFMWDKVIYAAGELKAVAYDAEGNVLGEQILMTAEKPVAVTATPEKSELVEGELGFVRIGLTDAMDTPVPSVDTLISYSVEGPAEIVAVANGDPGSHCSFYDTASHPLYHGRGVVILRRQGPGVVTLTAAAEGLKSAKVKFDF